MKDYKLSRHHFEEHLENQSLMEGPKKSRIGGKGELKVLPTLSGVAKAGGGCNQWCYSGRGGSNIFGGFRDDNG